MAYKNDKTKNRRRYKSRYHSAHNYKQKHTPSEKKAAVLVSVLTFLIIASLVVIFTYGDSILTVLEKSFTKPESTQPTVISVTPSQKPTSATESKATEEPTQEPTQEPTTPPVEQDDQFLQLLKLNGLKETDLKGDQMIFVDSNESDLTCKVYCYEKGSDGIYKQSIGPFNGYVGQGGVSDFVAPYENKTPTGVFKIEYAVGTRYNPGAGISYSQFTYGDHWVTDPNSINYNRWVNASIPVDYSTSQNLWEYTISYPYAVVFDYNRSPVDKTQGAAKFLHVKYAPTDGGVGIAESDILSILYWLKESKTPYIAISK